jgi:hypothetical protein
VSASFDALKLGQQVWATVEEAPFDDKIVVNFDGDFVKVLNTTESPLDKRSENSAPS